MKTNSSLLICSFIIFLGSRLQATHNRSGEILYYKIPGAYTYSIVVIKYHNDGPNVADRCVDTVQFGDGTKGVATRLPGNISNCGCASPNGCGDLILNLSNYVVKKSVYVVVHTYPGPGNFMIRSFDPNRSSGSINIPNSVNVPFYIESNLIIDQADSQNSSPQLTRPPIDQGVVAGCFYHNPCAFDPDGDSLSFEITSCRGISGQIVPGYSFPATGSGGTFGINNQTGLLTWCNPQLQGIYNVAFIVKEWRRPDCNSPYVVKGYVLRDMEILVGAGSSSVITVSGLSDTCLVAGSQFTKSFNTLFGGQPFTFNCEIFGSTTSSLTGSTPAVVTPSSVNTGSAATVSWNTTCINAQRQSHYIHLVITANLFPVPRTFYKTVKVQVSPPQPTITSVVTNTNSITISWNNINGCNNINAYNIYLSVNNSSWTPGSCVTGVPSNAGYSYVATVPAGVGGVPVQYTDNSLGWLPVTTTANYIITSVTTDCTESMVDTIVTQKLLVGIANNILADDNLQVFPNPSSSKFIITTAKPFNDRVHIELYTNDGRTVWEDTFTHGSTFEVDSSVLPEGIYLLELTSGNIKLHRKLIKE